MLDEQIYADAMGIDVTWGLDHPAHGPPTGRHRRTPDPPLSRVGLLAGAFGRGSTHHDHQKGDMTDSRVHSAHSLRRVPVCGEETTLTPDLVLAAVSAAGQGRAHPEDVEVSLRCVLQAHVDGEHHAFVLQLDGTEGEAVWTSWSAAPPTQLEVRADCKAVSAPERGAQPCCEFAGHPGAHTYDTYDRWTFQGAAASVGCYEEPPAVEPGGPTRGPSSNEESP